jgi:hypothetical protein
MKILLAAALASLLGTAVGVTPVEAEMPMAEYLALLGQIAPVAQDGAIAYTRAFEARCGRPMTSTQLRRTIAEGSGDPLLWHMMRAARARDSVTLARLGQQISCGVQP